MDKEYLIDFVKKVGPHMALVIFFVWQGMQREDRLNRKIDTLETYIRTELKAIIKSDHEVIKENSGIIRNFK